MFLNAQIRKVLKVVLKGRNYTVTAMRRDPFSYTLQRLPSC